MISSNNFLKKIMGETLRQQKAESLSESIRENLGLLLNTRQGMVPHLPDFGLPDIHHVFQSMPKSLETMAAEIKAVVEKYEPRLQQVKVKLGRTDTENFRASFFIRAVVHEGSRHSTLAFQTDVLRDGEAVTFVVDP